MPPLRWLSTCWFSTIAIALLAALAPCGGVLAQGSNLSRVTGVDVDVNAADAVQASQQGIAEARRKAAKMLVDRMVAPEDRARVAMPSDASLEAMVRGVEFVRERSAPGRYIATLDVVFSPDPVKAWLGGAGVRIAETVSRPALVIPLWKGKAGVEPLDDRNAWREAWRTLDKAGSSVPVTVIRGDQLDQNAVTAEEVYVGDVSALARLNERYRAPTILVAVVEGDKESGPLSVGGLRYDTQTGARSEIPRAPGPDSSQLADAAKQIHAKLDEQWRGVAVVRRDSQDTLDVFVPIRALRDSLQVRQRLGGVPALKSVVVRTLEADRAELRLEYFGTTHELQRPLALAAVTLHQQPA